MRSKRIRGKALLLVVFSCLFFLSGCGRPREKYDSNGRLIESVYKIDKGYYVRTEYEYDESGNLILKHPVTVFNGEEEPMLDDRYAYDDRGRMISSEAVYFDGRVSYKWLYYYNDDDDSPYLTERYDGEGTLTNWNEYEREKNGESRKRQYEVTENGSYLKAIVYYTSDGQVKKREEQFTQDRYSDEARNNLSVGTEAKYQVDTFSVSAVTEPVKLYVYSAAPPEEICNVVSQRYPDVDRTNAIYVFSYSEEAKDNYWFPVMDDGKIVDIVFAAFSSKGNVITGHSESHVDELNSIAKFSSKNTPVYIIAEDYFNYYVIGDTAYVSNAVSGIENEYIGDFVIPEKDIVVIEIP